MKSIQKNSTFLANKLPRFINQSLKEFKDDVEKLTSENLKTVNPA